MEDSIYCWNLLMDTCFGEHKAEIERYIGRTLLLEHELDKRYIFIGGPGTGKSSLLILIHEIFSSDPFILIVHDADIARICFDRIYKEKDMLIDENT